MEEYGKKEITVCIIVLIAIAFAVWYAIAGRGAISDIGRGFDTTREQLQDAESRQQEERRTIESAESAVESSEQSIGNAENAIESSEQSIESSRESIGRGQESVGRIQESIAGIQGTTEQIEAVERRDAEVIGQSERILEKVRKGTETQSKGNGNAT